MTSTQSLKPKYPTLTVQTKDPTKPPVGANIRVLLDGKPIPYCHSVKFEANARAVSKITLEVFGYAEIEAMGDFHMKILPLKAKKAKGVRRGRKA
mgnify:CR=1 FL=1